MRNRYLDSLRAFAIVRVVVYHLFGWPWLSIVFPAMGVMFALAGSLTAASLEKRGAGAVVFSRLRRLLPPLWLLGLLAVPVMIALGWPHETGGQAPYSPQKLLLWIVPVGDPPGSDKAVDVWDPLWYIRAYLWFVLLSPVLFRFYRRLGWAAVALPLALIVVLDVTGFALPDVADSAMWDFVTFAACWMTGFAHHDGRLARLRPGIVVPVAVALAAGGLYWLVTHPGPDGIDLNDVAEAQAPWSLAFVLVALRWQPRMDWLARVRPLDGAVTFLNARAVTIYLWHNIAIDAIWPVLGWLALDHLGWPAGTVEVLATALVTLVAVLLFGWAEDLAARRWPRWWPASASGRPGRPGSGSAGLAPAGGEPRPAWVAAAAERRRKRRTAWSGPTLPGPAWSDPTLPGPAWSGPTLPGPAWSGPTLPGPAWSGPTLSGPALSGTALSGSTLANPIVAGSARINPAFAALAAVRALGEDTAALPTIPEPRAYRGLPPADVRLPPSVSRTPPGIPYPRAYTAALGADPAAAEQSDPAAAEQSDPPAAQGGELAGRPGHQGRHGHQSRDDPGERPSTPVPWFGGND